MDKLKSIEKQNIKNAFDSILRADYISIDQISQLQNLSKYYIDFFNNTSNVLQKQDNFVCGRRGTGKTTLILRGYYECLKTISPKIQEKSDYVYNEKILPIYIDLSTCNDLFDPENELKLVEIHFVRQIIESLKKQLEVMFDEKFLLLFKKENPALDDLEYIERVLVEGLTLSRNKNVEIQRKDTSIDEAALSGKVTTKEIGYNADLKNIESSEVSQKLTEIKGLNVQEFLDKINDIRKKAKIDCLYVFIDEFSDLNSESQLSFSKLLKNFLGTKINMFFKLGVITDRFDFGDKIIVGRDIFPIPLDINEYVERFDGAVAALKKMEEFISTLIEKRIEVFCNGLIFEDILRVKKDLVYQRIAKEAVGVPRTIGLILQNAWKQAQTKDSKIGLQEINYGIRSTRKTYYRQFEGSVKKKLISPIYMEIWDDLLQKAISEKNKHRNRPASHFLIDPMRKEYLNFLCENFLIHFLEENRSSKYGGKYNLYCFDYDVCLDYDIKYAEEKDEFTAARFIYDSVLSKYDAYFVKDKLKSYKCPICGKIYEEKEVVQFKVKRCCDDDAKLEEIIHRESPKTEGNYAEVEIKILGLISTLQKDEAMSAQEIADAVGCSRQKVAIWGTRVLAKKGLINIKYCPDRNLYYSND